MACCDNLCEPAYNAGCFEPCGVLVLPTDATSTGDYTLEVGFNGQKVTITDAQTNGEPISFVLEGINEAYTFVGQVFDETGTLVQIETKDYIKFKTTKAYALG